MTPPFFVDDAGDVSVFLTLDEAEKALEPPDVGRADCAVYDSEGRRLPTFLEPGLLRHRVRIREPESAEPLQAEALRNRLVGFLVSIGEPRDVTVAQSLEELVATTVNRLKPRKS